MEVGGIDAHVVCGGCRRPVPNQARRQNPATAPQIKPHISSLGPRIDARVPEQGLQDGQVAKTSRHVNGRVASLPGEANKGPGEKGGK